MARVIYGVSGEGSGHSSRAREMASHLGRMDHEVRIVSYDRGARDLEQGFEVFEVEGLHLAAEDNKISVVKTFIDNISRLPEGHRRFQALRRDLFKGFAPDVVITDFEPTTAYLAIHYGIPLITLDNQHRMRYMEYACPARLRADAAVTETVIRAMVPKPDVSLVTTFYRGPVTNDRTFLFPPILRSEVLKADPSRGDHILVYLTQGFDSFVDRLAQFPRERFRVYGTGRTGVDGHLDFRPFSREGFLDDLASCRAVMATAGFTLITEALHLGKPYLAMPMKGQFEQELNALLLDELGYGVVCRRVSADVVAAFLYRAPELAQRLEAYPRSDNSEITGTLDRLLEDRCRLAHEYHARRRCDI